MSDNPPSMNSDVAVAQLRGEVREGFAEIRGSLNTLAAQRTGDVQRLDAEVKELGYKLKTTDQAGLSLHERIDKYPPAADVHAVVKYTQEESGRRKAWMVLAGVVSPVVSSLTVAALLGAFG